MKATDPLERRAHRGTPRGADSVFDAALLGPLRASGQEPSRNRVPLLVAGAMLVVAIVGGSVLLGEQNRTRVTTLPTQASTPLPGESGSVETSPAPQQAPQASISPSPAVEFDFFERTGPGAFDHAAGTVPNVVIRGSGFRVTAGSVTVQPVSRAGSRAAFQAYRDPVLGFDGPTVNVRALFPGEQGIQGETGPVSVGGVEGQLVEGAFLREIVWSPVGQDARFWLRTSGLTTDDSAAIADSVAFARDGTISLDLPPGLEPTSTEPDVVESSSVSAQFSFEFEQTTSNPLGGNGAEEVTPGRPGGTLEMESGSQLAFESVLAPLLRDATGVRNAKVADIDKPATDGAIVTRADGEVVALWYASGLVFKLTPEPESAVEVELWLNEMAVVSDDEWQLLVPPDWVARNDVADAAEQLMEDIPTPAGFDTATILAAAAPGDPEQLASRTASLVACAWINQWLRAADSASAMRVNEAVSAMQTISSWPAVQQLSQDSPARRALIDYAAAMATESGIVGGSELTVGASYQQALGCF